MAHRSVPPTDPEIDPFWKDAFHAPPPWWERLAGLRRSVRSLRSVVLIALGVGAVAALGWWLLRPSAAPVESTLPMAGTPAGSTAGASSSPRDGSASGSGAGAGASSSSTSTTTVEPMVVAQAAGAVDAPGVYTLPAGARVDDLVDAAGGLTKRADLDRVNLAAPVVDGERVWVPAKGDREVPEVIAGAGGGAGGGGGGGAASGPADSGGGGAAPTSPVDLNSATAAELDALPGVGPATSAAILSHREQNGPFTAVEDLLDVRGIGDAKLEQLRPLVRV